MVNFTKLTFLHATAPVSDHIPELRVVGRLDLFEPGVDGLTPVGVEVVGVVVERHLLKGIAERIRDDLVVEHLKQKMLGHITYFRIL